jgi:U32 family peptidase
VTGPEVLAPVGGRPQLIAAINAGADAVYFGLTAFNARARAANFTPDELPDVMAQLHDRGVQGFVTLNTLVFDEELADVDRYVRLMDDARVDAVIVQDLGVAAQIREVAPNLPLHGSTQMTVTSAESADLVARLGLERVVLGRELSVAEIAHIVRNTPLEVEVFVHGALCVSYSGQCFSSEAWGGRSANRGQCAQACRLPYDLLVDGRSTGDDAHRYVLSPQDLYGAEFVPALIDAGVSCFKIEGRLKGPEYVALTTATYRRAVDAALAGTPWAPSEEELVELQQVFSRGLTPGFLEGPKHQRLVRGRFPKHRGVRMGEVTDVRGRQIRVQLDGALKRGDGVVFDGGRPHEDEVGGTVHTLLVNNRPVDETAGAATLKLGTQARVDRVRVGDIVWRNKDPALSRRLAEGWVRGADRRSPLVATVRGALDEPLSVTYSDGAGRSASAQTDRPLQAASNRGLDADSLRAALGRLGATPFTLESLDVDLAEGLFVPVSALNRARRTAIDALTEARRSDRVRTRPERAPARVTLGSVDAPAVARTPSLSLLCRTREQVDAALQIDGLDEIAVDFLEVKGLGDAVSAIQAAGRRAVAVSPRVLKPKEENLRAYLLKLGADAILVRSLGLLRSLLDAPAAPPLYGDFSLNATNQRTVDLLLGAGLARLAPGHDLNAAQLTALATSATAPRLEVIAHHHLPVFHTEHCVFARFLSDGDSKKDCGAPCEHHALHLVAPDGEKHLVQADMGCRNTVFNGRAQSAVRSTPALLAAGYRHFRIELVDHRPDEVAPLLQQYRDALEGRTLPKAAWRWLQSESRFGVTLGSLKVVDALAPEDMKRPGWMR